VPLVSPAVQLGSTRRQEPLPPGAPWYRRLWRGWQRVVRAIGNLLSRTITSFAYLVVVPPFALGVRLFSDPLGLRPGPARWSVIPPAPAGLEEARRGF